MRVRPAVVLMLLSGLCPTLAQALALGEITLNSGLNEPLDAQIEVLSATPEEITHLSATVAARETFERYGLDRPDFLSGLRFVVDRSGGQAVLRVLSAQPISEPFVTFLVEAQWRRGRLLREYTVLLDPPVFLPTPERVAPVAPPRSVASQTRPSSGRIARDPAPRSTPPRRLYSGTPPAFGATYGPIRRNETLWGIAERLRTDRSISMNQMMIAIYRENQDAFLGNINLMKEGSTLRIPTRAAVESVNRQNAFATAVAHNQAWRAGKPAQVATTGTAPSTVGTRPDAARLRLVEPDGTRAGADAATGTGAALDTTTRETLARNEADIARLSSENEQLRSDLEEIRRLLTLRDSELALLQRQAADAAVTGPAVSPAVTDTPVAVTADDTVAAVADTPADTAPEVETAVDTAVPAPADATAQTDIGTPVETTEPPPADDAAAEQPPVPVVTTSLPDEPGLVTKIVDMAKSALGSLWLWIALGAALLAGFGMVALRGRGEEQHDAIEALTREARETTATGDTSIMKKLEPVDDAAAPASDVEFFDDSGTFKPVDFSAAKTEAQTGEYPFEDTVGGEIKLDQSDPLAEADFHMAYGLYDQASDLVKKAVAREPDRVDLRMKLLEIFFVWGNQDEFRGTAQDLHDNMSEQIAGEWDKIVIMGKQICPEDSLFAGDAAIGAAADIDLEFSPTGSQVSVDLDTGGESGGGDAIDLDFGGALDAAPDVSAGASDATNDLLDLDFGDEALAALGEDEADETRPEPVDEIKDQIRARLSSTDTDETAEMDLSDLGVDLDLAGVATSDDQAAESAGSTAENEFGSIFEAPAPESEVTSELPAPTTELTAGAAGLDLDIGEMFGGLDSEDTDETARDLASLEESMEQTGPAPAGDTADRPDTDDTGHFSAEVETLHGDALDVDISAFGDDEGDKTHLILAGDDEPTGSHGEDAFSAQVFGVDESDDDTRLIGPDTTGSHAEDSFSAAIFGEDETVQVPGAGGGNGQDDDDVFGEDPGLDLDIGDSLPEDEDRTTVKVATSDLALPEGGDELSEVGTKLDLARAYMDMGDPDGARGILEEVLAEGNELQQADAREMLSSLT